MKAVLGCVDPCFHNQRRQGGVGGRRVRSERDKKIQPA